MCFNYGRYGHVKEGCDKLLLIPAPVKDSPPLVHLLATSITAVDEREEVNEPSGLGCW